MPRTKKTTVSRETSSASTLRGSADAKLKSEPPPENVVKLPSGNEMGINQPILWREFGPLVTELGYELTPRIMFDALAARVEELEKKIGVVIEQSGGYSMEQWVEDYNRWRDRVIGLALDDAIAALKPEK